MLRERHLALRAVGGLALAGIVVGLALDWREPPLRDMDYARYTAKYERAKPGDKIQIPHPPNWGILLTKK